MSRPFIRGQIAIDSMRDNGFLSAAHALAELIDNSIQAGADSVELIAFEHAKESKKGRTLKEIDKIGVLDNGCGMNPDTLHLALEFGASKNREDAKGIGKFGMGLPNSSISQAQRVDVWSWTVGNPIHHTYLDIELIKQGKLENIPKPKKEDIPKEIASVFDESIPVSGTLVLWSKIDRCRWKTGKSIYQHTEKIVGRMYRNFLTKGAVSIRYKSAEKTDKLFIVSNEERFLPNDPIYLMKDTSLPPLPADFKGEAMFELVNECQYSFQIPDEHGEVQQVKITGTAVKKSVLQAIRKGATVTPGATEWGKHALANYGLSVVRAGREIALLPDFYAAESKNRGWGRFYGIQIEFDPSLDNVFGVTNNKQHAVNLVTNKPSDDAEAAGYDSESEYRSELLANNDPKLAIYEVLQHIKEVEKRLVNVVSALNFTERNPSDGVLNSGEGNVPTSVAIANEAGAQREEVVPTDEPTVTAEQIEVMLDNAGVENGRDKAKTIAERKLMVWIDEVPMATSAFFDVSTKQGVTLVQINSNHAFTAEVLNKSTDEQRKTIELCLAGWARMERECSSDKRLLQLKMARQDWGQMLEDYLGTDE